MTDRNAWVHAVTTAVAVAAGIIVELSAAEWRWIIAAIAIVWIAEGFNTAIERLSDAISQTRNENIRFAKDVSAGAVLIALGSAALIALTVFGPHIGSLLD